MLKDGALREGVSDSTSHAHAMLPAWRSSQGLRRSPVHQGQTLMAGLPPKGLLRTRCRKLSATAAQGRSRQTASCFRPEELERPAYAACLLSSR